MAHFSSKIYFVKTSYETSAQAEHRAFEEFDAVFVERERESRICTVIKNHTLSNVCL
jgi:hypothetical protein